MTRRQRVLWRRVVAVLDRVPDRCPECGCDDAPTVLAGTSEEVCPQCGVYRGVDAVAEDQDPIVEAPHVDD